MKTCNKIYSAAAGVLTVILLAGLCVPTAFGQLASVSRYKQTTFTGTWIDATGGSYLGYDDDGTYTFSAPFDFPYDSTTISTGSNITVSDNGVFEIKQNYYVSYSDDAEGNASYPGALCLYSTDLIYDLNSVSNHGNYWTVTGSAPNRILTIEEYSNSPYYESTPVTSFEAQIHETSGVIEFLYADHNLSMVGSDNPNPVGIGLNGESNSGVDYNAYSGTGSSTPSTDLRFSPPAPAPKGMLTLLPTSLNFGSATPNSPVTMCVTAYSVGVGPLDLKSAFVTGSMAYSIVSGPTLPDSLYPGQNIQFCIQFTPLTGGTLTGSFTLVTDADSNGTQSASLTGFGAVPDVSYNGVTSLFHRTNVMLSDTSAVEYVPVTSTGGGPLHFFSIYFTGLNADNYIITRMPQNPLPVDVTDSIGIAFTPTLEGRPDATLIINTDASNIPWDTVQLFGVGVLPHLLITVPPPGSGSTVNFDSVKVGDSACQQIMLKNVGSDTLQILRQLVTYGDYDFTYHPLTGTDTTLPPGDSAFATVCFKPLRNGTRLATIRYFTNIPRTYEKPARDTGEFDIQVTGVGVPFGQLGIFGSLNDTAVVGKTNCLNDTLVNTGQANLTVTSVRIAPATANFTFTGTATPFSMAAHGTLGVSLCFTPTARGTEIDTLFIAGSSDGTPTTDTVLLTGVGIVECVSADSILSFGTSGLTLVDSVTTSCITVTNCGDVATTYTASLPSGTGYTLLLPFQSAVVPAGGTAQFCVTFTPTAIGAAPGSVVITGGPNPDTTILGGVGAGVIAIASGAPAAAVPIDTCNTFDITITDTGNVAWTPGAGTIGGTNGADFKIVSGPTPATIAPGGSATVTIDFCPTIAGTEAMTLTFPQEAPMPVAGAFSYSTTAIGAASSVAIKTEQDGFVLGASYPNPTNGEAAIQLTLPNEAPVRIDLLNATGALVRTVFTGNLSAGTQTLAINAKGLPSGTYFYSLTSGNVRLIRQLTLVK